MMGVTASYVGSIAEDVWSKRVEENFYDPFEAAAIGDPMAMKRRKLTPQQLSKMCEDEGLDPSVAKNRTNVGRMHKEKTLQDWSTAAHDAAADIGGTTSPLGISSAPLEHF
jgi:hypothetical protein